MSLSAQLIPLGVDLVAIAVLSYGMYFRRYHRHDLFVAYVALNIGVLVVTWVMVSAAIGIGLGLGLLGVLSIIRLRSDTVTQEEIGYYFAALALGLLGGVRPSPLWLGPALSGLLLVVIYVVDHPRLHRRLHRRKVTLDAAYVDERVLAGVLTGLLGAEVRHLIVLDVDFVRDVTTVDVRYRTPRRRAAAVAPTVPVAAK